MIWSKVPELIRVVLTVYQSLPDSGILPGNDQYCVASIGGGSAAASELLVYAAK